MTVPGAHPPRAASEARTGDSHERRDWVTGRLFGVTSRVDARLARAVVPTTGDVRLTISLKLGRRPSSEAVLSARESASPAARLSVWQPGVSRYDLSTSDICCYPERGVDPRIVELGLLGGVFGTWFEISGCTVLHAAAVAVGRRCLLFLGESGMGKSALAAEFLASGDTSLADDLSVVEWHGSRPRVRPAFPAMRVFPDHLEQVLGLDDLALRLEPVSPGYSKLWLPVGQPGV